MGKTTNTNDTIKKKNITFELNKYQTLQDEIKNLLCVTRSSRNIILEYVVRNSSSYYNVLLELLKYNIDSNVTISLSIILKVSEFDIENLKVYTIQCTILTVTVG